MTRRVLAITGIRSDYDLMTPVYRAIDQHPDLELRVAVAGGHLAPTFGLTIRDIRNDGFVVVDEIESLLDANSLSARVKGLAIQLQGLVQTVTRERPDVLLVLGDREESMSTALLGAYMGIPVAHVAGGDRVVGNVDDQVRHAVSKLSHLHFTTCEDSRQRLLKMGEQPFRCITVGHPGLDRLAQTPTLDDADLMRRLDFRWETDTSLLLVLQHVISTESEQGFDQMSATLDALEQLALPAVLIYPNSDAGTHGIIAAIERFQRTPRPWLHIARNLPRLEFVNVMRRAAVMVGNSSAGIMEAPFLKLPVINVGNRQKGRLHAENVQFVPHDAEAIQAAVHRATRDPAYAAMMAQCSSPYGDGKAAARITDVLATVDLSSETFMIKDLTY